MNKFFYYLCFRLDTVYCSTCVRSTNCHLLSENERFNCAMLTELSRTIQCIYIWIFFRIKISIVERTRRNCWISVFRQFLYFWSESAASATSTKHKISKLNVWKKNVIRQLCEVWRLSNHFHEWRMHGGTFNWHTRKARTIHSNSCKVFVRVEFKALHFTN